VAAICGVARQTIYDWIRERRVERLIDALRLTRASGVPIENLAGDDVEKLAAPVRGMAQEREELISLRTGDNSRSIPEGTEKCRANKKALHRARELLREATYDEEQ
jgi:hypothetical protein